MQPQPRLVDLLRRAFQQYRDHQDTIVVNAHRIIDSDLVGDDLHVRINGNMWLSCHDKQLVPALDAILRMRRDDIFSPPGNSRRKAR